MTSGPASDQTDPLDLVGKTILEKYAVEAIVGKGGFAVVYRAQHTLWKRPVAVKVFSALGEVAEDQRAQLLKDFIQEGALLAELSERSTAIVQARDVGTLTTPKGDHVPYMVLEWLEGSPLDALLEAERARGAPLRSLEHAVRLLDPVAEALALAHKKGIAHRDVKPANVFVLQDESVKLLDFGIAKVVQDAQKMGFGKTAGHITSFTPMYGAPEQFNREYGSTGPWTDVFALALVASEVVSGREPMPGDTIVQLAYAAADPQKRPSPRSLGVVTSDQVEAVFSKALAVKTQDRFQTAGEFWNALKAAMRGDLYSSTPSQRSAALAGPPANAGASHHTGPGLPNDTAVGSAFDKTSLDTGSNPNMISATAASPSSDRRQMPPMMMNANTARPVEVPSQKSSAPLIAGIVAVVILVVGGGLGAVALRGGTAGKDPPGGLSSGKPLASASASSPIARASASASVGAIPAKDCPAGMVLVPGGEFFMGSDEKDAQPNERPSHKVKVDPYCLDKHEVTVGRYKACSDRGACKRAGKENVWPGITAGQQKTYDPLCNINDADKLAKHPINCVDWEQAKNFCEANGGRLPSEAEWEFAARGSDGRIYPWGDDAPSAKLLNACGQECVAWMKKHPDPAVEMLTMYDADDGYPNTAPVGSFPDGKSRYGIEDVVGNVWEWVGDWYAEYDAATTQSLAANPTGPGSGKERVIRGGSWNGSHTSWVRPSFRFHVAPSARSYGFGFRCAKNL